MEPAQPARNAPDQPGPPDKVDYIDYGEQMQAIAETVFHPVYLVSVTVLGVSIFRRASEGSGLRIFGAMAIILGFGDAFHLLPRIYALWTTGMDANAAALGVGKLVTSVTMTVFYVMLYEFWLRWTGAARTRWLAALVYGLAAIRIALVLMPQNQWLSADPPLSWGIYRNLPFLVLGGLTVALFAREPVRQSGPFRNMWLAIVLSFAFYAPVVLAAGTYPIAGTLMIPKTLAYVWMVVMGLKASQAQTMSQPAVAAAQPAR